MSWLNYKNTITTEEPVDVNQQEQQEHHKHRNKVLIISFVVFSVVIGALVTLLVDRNI